MNPIESNQLPLDEMLISSYEMSRETIVRGDISKVELMRDTALQHFKTNRFPDSTHEKWKNTEIENLTCEDFVQLIEPAQADRNMDELFRCEVHNFDTEIVSMLNGWYHDSNEKLRTLPDGVVVGSFKAAMNAYPALFEQYYGEIAQNTLNGFTAINTALVQDGVFIYVPDGVNARKTLQIIKMIDLEENLFVQNRNLIILGRNSSLSLMHCDDSINQHSSLVNTVTEIFVSEGARFELYKLQNLNDQSGLVNTTFIRQMADSTVKTNTLTFNCGLIRNTIHINLDGSGAHADVLGLYLMDKSQHVDNQIRINHNQPNCTSNELFKGIIDDQASAVFNGYIHVARDAQKTNAYQNNNNILLKPTATINTKPFLEIYADDVKCSHGATIGQLDQDAMFYLRSRGISKANARLLLMYAFASDIISEISIEPLRNRIDDMVKKRLRGELSVCEKCVLHCGSPEKEYHFDIDYSKL